VFFFWRRNPKYLPKTCSQSSSAPRPKVRRVRAYFASLHTASRRISTELPMRALDLAFPTLLVLATVFRYATANKHASAVLQARGAFWEEPFSVHDDLETSVTATSPPDDQTHPLWDAGLRGDGQVVGVGDSGLDLGSCWLRDKTGTAPGPGHRKVVAYRAIGDYQDAIGHGTHVVATIVGEAEEGGTEGGLCDSDAGDDPCAYNGMAPNAKVSFTDLGVGATGTLFLPQSLQTYFDADRENGAFVHSNSWGNDVSAYDAMAREVDDYVWRNRDFLPIFAAGNYGGFVHSPSLTSTSSTVTSPSTSKNCLSIGATLGEEGPSRLSPRSVGDSLVRISQSPHSAD
jgi:subtilisin family serine protease